MPSDSGESCHLMKHSAPVSQGRLRGPKGSRRYTAPFRAWQQYPPMLARRRLGFLCMSCSRGPTSLSETGVSDRDDAWGGAG